MTFMYFEVSKAHNTNRTFVTKLTRSTSPDSCIALAFSHEVASVLREDKLGKYIHYFDHHLRETSFSQIFPYGEGIYRDNKLLSQHEWKKPLFNRGIASLTELILLLQYPEYRLRYRGLGGVFSPYRHKQMEVLGWKEGEEIASLVPTIRKFRGYTVAKFPPWITEEMQGKILKTGENV